MPKADVKTTSTVSDEYKEQAQQLFRNIAKGVDKDDKYSTEMKKVAAARGFELGAYMTKAIDALQFEPKQKHELLAQTVILRRMALPDYQTVGVFLQMLRYARTSQDAAS